MAGLPGSAQADDDKAAIITTTIAAVAAPIIDQYMHATVASLNSTGSHPGGETICWVNFLAPEAQLLSRFWPFTGVGNVCSEPVLF